MIKKIKAWAAKLKKQLIVLHLAYRDLRTPWYAKALVVFIIAYALSPIDLIPDFIPVLGYLDDIILLPIGIYFALKLIPYEVIKEAKIRAETYEWKKKQSRVGFVMVLLVWFMLILFMCRLYFNLS
jgi:uncharacterized membrane protein YkvA (DUF1232 family)